VRHPARYAIEGSLSEREPVMEKIDLFRQIIDRGFNQGDLAVADELCAPTLIEHEYLVPPHLRGAEILKFQIQAARTELRYLTLAIEDFVEHEDKVWVRMRGTGSDPRSGKSVVMDVFDICRFKDGKLVEHWGVPDRFALLHQVGALPPRPV
jgi:predicted SnoaL-like aldol condensation-catalyzing enzyme